MAQAPGFWCLFLAKRTCKKDGYYLDNRCQNLAVFYFPRGGNQVSLEGLKKSVKNVYGWKTEDGQVTLKMDLPEIVKERVEYFREESENGLTFMGYMTAVLGYEEDEKENRETFDMYASVEWLPASEEFKNWRDEYLSMRQLEVATAIIYGVYEWEDKK